MPFLTASGGSVLFLGDGGHYFIGPVRERSDLVMLVRQTNIESFFAFASDEARDASVQPSATRTTAGPYSAQ